MTKTAARLPVCYLSITWKDRDAAEFYCVADLLDEVDRLNKYYGHTYQFADKHSPMRNLSGRHVITVSNLQGRHIGYFESEAL